MTTETDTDPLAGLTPAQQRQLLQPDVVDALRDVAAAVREHTAETKRLALSRMTNTEVSRYRKRRVDRATE